MRTTLVGKWRECSMERRSSRQRKCVNYHEFIGGCDSGDSEDDFAGGPPAKKAKPEKKSVTKNKQHQQLEIQPLPNNGQLQRQQTPDVPKGRLSRDEKQFNRQLDQAVAASVHDTSQPGSDEPSPVDNRNNKEENDGDFCPSSEEDGNDSSSCVLTEGDEDSDFDVSPHPKGAGKGKGTKVKPKKMTAKTEGRKTKAKEKKVVPKSTASKGRQKATTGISPVPTATKSKPIGSGLEATLNSSLPGTQRTPGLGVRRAPKWTPPAHVGSENATTVHVKSSPVSSGGSPAIRVGLSRNVRVKSLHAKVGVRNT